jgi:transcriptional regulator with XRE-family HTH domain
MNIVKKIRIQLDYTQREFAKKLSASLDTVKSWEMGRRHPTGSHVEMLMLLTEDPNLKADLENLHPIYSMAKEVLEYIDEQQSLRGDDVKLRFVLSGVSGCGKTRTVYIVNKKLPEGAELAECNDLIYGNSFCKALGIVNNEDLKYPDSQHIVFSVLNEDLASSLESNEIKVFRFN